MSISEFIRRIEINPDAKVGTPTSLEANVRANNQ